MQKLLTERAPRRRPIRTFNRMAGCVNAVRAIVCFQFNASFISSLGKLYNFLACVIKDKFTLICVQIWIILQWMQFLLTLSVCILRCFDLLLDGLRFFIKQIWFFPLQLTKWQRCIFLYQQFFGWTKLVLTNENYFLLLFWFEDHAVILATMITLVMGKH